MLRCLTTSTYSHKCDVLEKISEWDYDTHTSNERWEMSKTGVACSAAPFINGGVRGNGAMEKWDEGMYVSDDYVRIKTKVPLLKSQRVTNVRALDGEIVWKEEEFDDEATLFNVDGCAPVSDPLSGKVLEYISTLSRAEVQSG